METSTIELDGAIERRFWQNVIVDDGCFVWGGGSRKDGYGYLSIGGKKRLAHRIMYTIFNGPIPSGLDIDHLCRNRACCRIDHLEAVTRQENLLRGDTLSAKLAARTHCNHGHEFTPENTYMTRGWRSCKTCVQKRNKETRQRRLERLASQQKES